MACPNYILYTSIRYISWEEFGMSTIDLMLLGVLIEKPMNAYEVKKEMENRNIRSWIKISSPSIYKNFLKLYKEGYIDGRVVREGEMPEKTVYSINEKGRNYFLRLMRQYSETPGYVYLDFCAFISNLPYMDQKTGLEMVDRLRESLAVKKDGINEQLAARRNESFYAASVLELYSRMFDLFCSWTDDFRKSFSEKKEP